MPTPGFDDPRLAAHPPAGNIFYPADVAASANLYQGGIQGSSMFSDPRFETFTGTSSRVAERQLQGGPMGGVPPLVYGSPATHTGKGEPIMDTAGSPRGHWSEIFNFHGSPAPWILIGILLVAGVLNFGFYERGPGKAGVKLDVE